MKHLLLGKRSGLVLLALLLLLVAPMTLLVSHVDLLAPVSDVQGAFFTLLTNSAGAQGFTLTLAVLIVGMTTLNMSSKQQVSKVIQLMLLLAIGFAAKTGLKQITESPRPYASLLTHQLLLPNPNHFYQLSVGQQDKVISKVSQRVSPWRTQHWVGETDYSFPSGHTIFAAICVAFFGGLFISHKRYLLAAGVMAWALGVAYSRLWLGMHRPIDLLASITFVVVLYAGVPHFTQLTAKIFGRLKHNVGYSS